MTTFKANQLPVFIDEPGKVTWLLDEYYCMYNFKTKTLVFEEFFGYDDEGNEESEPISNMMVIGPIVQEYDPVVVTQRGVIHLYGVLQDNLSYMKINP